MRKFNKKVLLFNRKKKQNVRDILTPHIVDCIVAMSSGYGGNLYEFFEKRTAAYCNTDGAAIFYTEQRKIEVEELRRRYQSELRWFTDFLDELMWVDTLYLGRESSVCVQFEQASEEEEEL